MRWFVYFKGGMSDFKTDAIIARSFTFEEACKCARMLYDRKWPNVHISTKLYPAHTMYSPLWLDKPQAAKIMLIRNHEEQR